MPGDRCRWRRDGPVPQRGALRCGRQVVSEHVLGDGIEHVLPTSTDQVWVGYFDEGFYGTYGWGEADAQEPVDAYGIARFPRIGARLALPQIHRGRAVGGRQRLLCPQRR